MRLLNVVQHGFADFNMWDLRLEDACLVLGFG